MVYIIHRHKLLIKGIVDPINKELLCGFQLERKNSGNMYTGLYNGFSETDDRILSLVAVVIGIKLCQLKESSMSLSKDILRINTLNEINKLLENRTYRSFLIDLKERLPPLVKFEYIEVYLYRKESII